MGDEYPTTLLEGELPIVSQPYVNSETNAHLTDPKRAQSHSFLSTLENGDQQCQS